MQIFISTKQVFFVSWSLQICESGSRKFFVFLPLKARGDIFKSSKHTNTSIKQKKEVKPQIWEAEDRKYLINLNCWRTFLGWLRLFLVGDLFICLFETSLLIIIKPEVLINNMIEWSYVAMTRFISASFTVLTFCLCYFGFSLCFHIYIYTFTQQFNVYFFK